MLGSRNVEQIERGKIIGLLGKCLAATRSETFHIVGLGLNDIQIG